MYGSWMPCSLEALHTLLCSKTFEEKLAEESVQDEDRTDGSAVRW